MSKAESGVVQILLLEKGHKIHPIQWPNQAHSLPIFLLFGFFLIVMETTEQKNPNNAAAIATRIKILAWVDLLDIGAYAKPKV